MYYVGTMYIMYGLYRAVRPDLALSWYSLVLRLNYYYVLLWFTERYCTGMYLFLFYKFDLTRI
jgi:hypothetical protein